MIRSLRFLCLMVCALMVIIGSGCLENQFAEPTATTSVSESLPDVATGLAYAVTVDEQPEFRPSGGPFNVPTDNCGARSSAFEEFSRSREFNVALEAAISESLGGKIGGDILVAGAEIEAAIEATLGLQIGSTESVSTNRTIETPPDSRSNVTLQWEEIWQPGFVTVIGSDGQEIGSVPYRVLTTIRLAQIGIEDEICGTLTPGGPTTVPDGETGLSGTTATSVPQSPATATSAPAPTDPPPMPTDPPPEPTDTPNSTMSEVTTVSAYRTALGRSYNTEIFVKEGDLVDISYLYGEWWIGQGDCRSGSGTAQTPTTAAGYLGRDGEQAEALVGCENPNRCRPLSAAPWGSLLGSIGEDGALFHIGEELEFTAQATGLLHLRVNYFNHNAVTSCPYGDGGEVTVQVDVTPP